MKRFKKDSLSHGGSFGGKHKLKDSFQKLEDERLTLKEPLAKCFQAVESATGQCLDICGKFNVTMANVQLKACQLMIEKMQAPLKELLTSMKDHTLKRREGVTGADWAKLFRTRQATAEKLCEYVEEHKDFFKKAGETVQEHTEQADRFKASLAKTDINEQVEAAVRAQDHEPAAETPAQPSGEAPSVSFAPASGAASTPSDKRKAQGGSVFGRDLTSILTEHNTTVPPIVEKLASFIESPEVIDTIGLFRIPGPTAKVQSLREELDQGKNVDLAGLHNPHLACALLKAYLRSLPEPLIVFSKFEGFIDVSKEVIETKQVNQLRSLVDSLPPHHGHVLEYMMAFCNRVATHSDQNKMTAKNLAALIAPNILYRKVASMTLLEDMNNANSVVEILIAKCGEIFKNISYDKKQGTVPQEAAKPTEGPITATVDPRSLQAIADAIISDATAAADSAPVLKINDKKRDAKPRNHSIVKKEEEGRMQVSMSDSAVNKGKISTDKKAQNRAAQLLAMGSNRQSDGLGRDVGGLHQAPRALDDKALRRRSSSLSTPSTPLVDEEDGYNSDDQESQRDRAQSAPRKAVRNRLDPLAHLKFENGDAFNSAMDEIFDPTNYTGFVVLSYTKTTVLHLAASAKGSVESLLPHLKEDEVQYCLVRLMVPGDEDTGAISTRDVFIQWNGPKVSNMQKGLKKSHVGEVKQIMQPFHAELVAVAKENFNEAIVLDRSNPLGGSHVID